MSIHDRLDALERRLGPAEDPEVAERRWRIRMAYWRNLYAKKPEQLNFLPEGYRIAMQELMDETPPPDEPFCWSEAGYPKNHWSAEAK